MNTSELSHARLIELIAQWEGRINTTHLQQHFNISRQTATKSIQTYCKETPGNLTYNPSIKGHIPLPTFKAKHCQGTIEEYSQLFNSSPSHYPTQNPFILLEAPLRNINPAIVRPIVKAIRNNLRIDIGYASVTNPNYEERIISPHSLVFTGLRWHTRAYCEKNQTFRDFVLSRFNGVFNEEGKARFRQGHDKKWNTWIDLIIEPDPRLSSAQKHIIELDYQMENGQRTLKTRAAMIMYLLQKLNLEQYKPTAEAQQIIVNSHCWKKIEKYLPN